MPAADHEGIDPAAATATASRSWRERLGEPLLVVVVAALVAAAGSWRVSLWTDEAITISASTRSWSHLLELLGRIDAVHGLYYAAMKPWIEVAGQSELMLRLPSALAAGGTALGVLVLGRRLVTPATALVAALLCGVLPRLAWAGIEARPFVFSALAAVWATWALCCALDLGGRSRWVRYFLLAVLGVLSNIYLAMLVMAHGVTVVALRRGRRAFTGYLISAASTALVTLPLLLLVRSQQDQLGTGEESNRSATYIARRILVNQVFLGETPSDGSLAPWLETAWQAAAILAALIGLALLAAAVVGRPRAGDARGRVLAYTLPWIVLPTAVVAAYAVLVAPIYQPRYFTFTVPAVALLLALGLRSLRQRWQAWTAAAMLVGTCLVVVVSQRFPTSKPFSDWAEAAAVMSRCAQPGDAVLFEPRVAGEVVTRTTRRIAYAYPDAFAGLVDVTALRSGPETGTLDGESAGLSTLTGLDDLERVWVVYGENDPAEVVEADAAVLATAGLAATGRWQGPSTTIVEYVAGSGQHEDAGGTLGCAS